MENGMVKEPPTNLSDRLSPVDAAGELLQELKAYERSQRSRTLGFIIWIALAAALILGTFDVQFKTWISVFALFGMALLCIPTLIINQRGNYILAAALLSFIVLVVITVNLYDGDGVRDPGLMAYPIFIMVGTLFFGKRAAPYFAGAAAASLAAIVLLEISGKMHPTVGPTKLSILIPMVTMLLAATSIVWVIIQNLEKYLNRAAQSEAELVKNYELTLEAWARVMEYRDRETEGHSRRLVELGTRLAVALGMSETEIVHLQRGALLHDIGKLAIPDEILLKPAALDQHEQKAMQKHPIYAKQMLAGIPFLEPSIPVAYSHHERWDGLGYPDGLKGENIPLAARLFAVVDTWDALGSERVYRPAWPPDQIAAYIKANAGVRFDPHIVQVFLGVIGRKG
jgi:HD domain-containing protein